VIISTIKQFLSDCPQSPPLRDLLPAWSSEAKSLLSVNNAPTDGSSTHVTQAASDEDYQNRYIVMIISVHSIILTLGIYTYQHRIAFWCNKLGPTQGERETPDVTDRNAIEYGWSEWATSSKEAAYVGVHFHFTRVCWEHNSWIHSSSYLSHYLCPV